MLTNKTTFRNCLVVMRPKTKVADLPSVNDIRIFLHNAFVQRLDKLKQDIQVRLVFFASIFELSVSHTSNLECAGKDLNHSRWLDCRQHKARLPRHDSTLDRHRQGRKMDPSSRGCRVPANSWYARWLKSRALFRWSL
jgi:hypothetical protein